jgi:hypothetical protein
MSTGGNWKREDAAQKKAMTEALATLKEKPELQKPIEKQAGDILQWENREGQWAGKPYDVTTLPGFGKYENLYGNAASMAARERRGNPMAAFARGANPNFAKQLELVNAGERHNLRAAGLSDAVYNTISQAHATAGDSIGWNMQQNQNYMNALQNQRQQHLSQKPKSPWEIAMQVAQLGIQGAGVAAGGAGALGWKPLGPS